MKVRTKFEDVANLALIYTYRTTKQKAISLNKILEFEKIVNENLENMNSNISPYLYYEEDKSLYYCAKDEKGNLYLVIEPENGLNIIKNYQIEYLPIDILIASQTDNSLNVLGLQIINDEIIEKDSFIKVNEDSLEKIKTSTGMTNSKDFITNFMNKLRADELKREFEPNFESEEMNEENINKHLDNYSKILNFMKNSNIQ